MRRFPLDPAIRAAISLLIVGGFFAILAVLVRGGVNVHDAADATLSVLLGALVGAVKDVTGFWFGSSLGSARKDEALATAASAGSAAAPFGGASGTATDPVHVEASIEPTAKP